LVLAFDGGMILVPSMSLSPSPLFDHHPADDSAQEFGDDAAAEAPVVVPRR